MKECTRNPCGAHAAAGVAAIAAGIMAGGASAADSAQAGANKVVELEEVIVTAQRVSEAASKTPLALSVYSGDTLKEQGVISVSDLQNVAPSVAVGRGAFGVVLAIRGITTADNTSKGDQGIAFNVDGIPVSRPAMMGLAFFDLERVEVLRGPQGTLYGKSSTGGVINVISNKPKDSFDASASLELGSYNDRRADMMLNVPVGSRFAVRGAINFNKRDGWLNPVLGNAFTAGSSPAGRNEQDDWSARLHGLVKFSDDASLLLTGNFAHVGGVGASNALYNSVLNKSGSEIRNVYYNPFGSLLDTNVHNYNAELNVRFGAVHVTYDGGHDEYNRNDRTSSTNDPRGNNGGRYNWGLYRGTGTVDSHELRFANAGPQRLEWVAGANYYNEDLNESDHNWGAPTATPFQSASINGIDPLNHTVHRSSGVFGQVNLHATEALKLTLGLRQSSDKVRRRGTFAAGPGPWPDPTGAPCVAPNDCVGGANNGDQNADKLTYRVGFDYQLADNQMVYASVATGYKSGGFNDFDPRTNAPSAYGPEDLRAYEVGYKGYLRPNLQLVSSAYYYDYPKAQIPSIIVINGANVSLTNLLSSTIYGLENELHWKLNEANQVDATLTFARSKYGTFLLGPGQRTDWTGQDRDKSPHVTAMLGYGHRWFMADGATFEARIASRYSGSYYLSDFGNAIHYTQGSFTRTDLTLTWSSASGKFEAQGFARNLEDKLQLLGAPGNVSATVVDSANMNVSEPRMVGMRVSVRY